MPRGDGTGPMGMGPMTGRGMGRCDGYAGSGYAVGFGRGRGRCFRRMYDMTEFSSRVRRGAYPYGFASYPYQVETNDVDEKKVLQNQMDFLEKQLKEVREKLKDFEKDE